MGRIHCGWSALAALALGCGDAPHPQAPTEAAPVLPAVAVALTAPPAESAAPVATPVPPAAAAAPEALTRGDDLSRRVVYVWLRASEARALEQAPGLLLAPAQRGAGAALRVADQRDDEAARAPDGWSRLFFHTGFARQRLVWPNLAGAVLQRDQGAFVAVRVELAVDTLVLDLERRSGRTLEGRSVPLEVFESEPQRLGVVAFRAGSLRAYSLVNLRAVARVEVGSDRVRAELAAELATLKAALAALDENDIVKTGPRLDALRAAFVEVAPARPMAAEERVVALAALADVEAPSFARALAPEETRFSLGQPTAPRRVTCTKTRHPGRPLAPGEWCGTGALPWTSCSDGCALESGECRPVAARW